MKKVFNIIVVSILTVAVLGCLAMLICTNGMQESFKNLIVTADNKVVSKATLFEIEPGQQKKIGVRYFFGNLQESQDFDVKIISNIDKKDNFDIFLSANERVAFYNKDFTKGFNLKKEKGYFSLRVETVESVFAKTFEREKLSYELPEQFFKNYFFKIIITSYNEKEILQIPLRIKIKVESIIIDSGGIIF